VLSIIVLVMVFGVGVDQSRIYKSSNQRLVFLMIYNYPNYVGVRSNDGDFLTRCSISLWQQCASGGMVVAWVNQ